MSMINAPRAGALRTTVAAAVAALLVMLTPGIANASPDDSEPPGGQPAEAPNWEEDAEATARAQELLAQMTVDEKVDMLRGELNNFYGFYNAPIERLGIPALTMADGPAGTRIANPDVNGQRSTQLPSPLLLAATWNAGLSEEYGALASEEAFLTGHNVLLSPALDIARLAQAGRAFEAYGEDPLLTGTMGAANVRGIQSQPVVGDVKHYNVYTQETNRLAQGNAVIDERTLQEIYTRPFGIAVEDGNPGSAMCAFNKVNGVYACENAELMTTILKEQLDFQGWIMSDYGATFSTVPAIMGGLDQEMPGNFDPANPPGTSFFGQPLIDAINAGEVPISRVDDAVLRILRPMFALGLFDQPAQVAPLPEAEHGAQAREIAEQGMVLLKNADALPLGDGIDSIAVIGADADAVVQGGGSSQVKPTYTVSPLEGITERAGAGVTVTHTAGADPVTGTALLPGPQPIPSDFLTTPSGDEPGLRAEYFFNDTFAGDPGLDRTEPYVGLNGGFLIYQGFNASSPHFPFQPPSLNSDELSVRWSGSLTAPVTGTYQLVVVATGTTTVYLDDTPVLTTSPDTTPREYTVDVPLTAGEARDLRVEYVTDIEIGEAGVGGAPAVKLAWVPPENIVAPQAAAAAEQAASADVAVVFARDYASEGSDRASIDLPNGQQELIRQVAAANPRTIVVLESGAAIQTSDWEENVAGVLQSWYGGQEQGNAVARILYGDVNPSGRLPITVPVDDDQTPTSSPSQFPGDGLDQQFSEGIFVGYRGYDEFDIAPQYPFGFGLSYTDYEYSDLRARTDVTDAGQEFRVQVTVKNTGSVAGRETVQVYAGELPTTAVATAEKSLAGWTQVDLQPGERKKVEVVLDPQSFSYWDVDQDAWVLPAGQVPIFVGSSSADERLTGELTVETVDVDPPVNTVLPTISGEPRVGSRLTAEPGAWSEEGLEFSYQWLRDGEPIRGATSEDYRVRRADQGSQLTVQVTAQPATGPAGVAVSEPVTVQTRAFVSVRPTPFVGTTSTEYSVQVRVRTLDRGTTPEGTVTVEVEGETFEGTLSDGRVDVPIGTQDRGFHVIRVSYSGSGAVAPANGTSFLITR